MVKIISREKSYDIWGLESISRKMKNKISQRVQNHNFLPLVLLCPLGYLMQNQIYESYVKSTLRAKNIIKHASSKKLIPTTISSLFFAISSQIDSFCELPSTVRQTNPAHKADKSKEKVIKFLKQTHMDLIEPFLTKNYIIGPKKTRMNPNGLQMAPEEPNGPR